METNEESASEQRRRLNRERNQSYRDRLHQSEKPEQEEQEKPDEDTKKAEFCYSKPL
jgi:hypothetical protein